jgi:glycerate kinase
MSPNTHVPQRVLVVSDAFGPRLTASTVASAIAEGIRDGGLPEPDLCPLPALHANASDIRGVLDELDFDARMRRSRAVLIAAATLEERALAGSITFEIATRARQGGVPAYAVTVKDALSAFDARILDLQVILQARGRKQLVAAGRRLAALV